MDIKFEGSLYSLFEEGKESSEFVSSWADMMSEEPIAAEGDLELLLQKCGACYPQWMQYGLVLQDQCIGTTMFSNQKSSAHCEQ